MKVTRISTHEVHVDRDDGASLQIVLDDAAGEWYVAKAGDADIVGYFPTLDAAIAAAKEA